uniref:Uncharacterized protein n=1 Tax=Arundo donax TaxID=35708 RepID=A0A0A8YJI9_ARUDO
MNNTSSRSFVVSQSSQCKHLVIQQLRGLLKTAGAARFHAPS